MSEKLYGVYEKDVKKKNRYNVPNLCKMKKYSSMSEAKASIGREGRKEGLRVYSLSKRFVGKWCRNFKNDK